MIFVIKKFTFWTEIVESLDLTPCLEIWGFEMLLMMIHVCRCNTSLLIDYCQSDGNHCYVLIDVGKTFREQVLRWFSFYKIPRVDSVSDPLFYVPFCSYIWRFCVYTHWKTHIGIYKCTCSLLFDYSGFRGSYSIVIAVPHWLWIAHLN